MNRLPTILASTWTDGLFVLNGESLTQEFAARPVRGISDDLNGGALALVDNHSLFQRSDGGSWKHLATSEFSLAVTLAVNGQVFVGTDDARVLVLTEDGYLKQIDDFDSIVGRETWYAGTATIDGKEIGPPLGVRSLSGANNGLLFANIHVGGIPRSINGGATWNPTIDIDLDAHEVCVHPNNAALVAAATAAGLCMSHDGGSSWSLHTEGLHASYCSAVAFVGDILLLAVSESHFSSESAIYRRGIEQSDEPMVQVRSGLPRWLEGIADTSCIASNSRDIALVDRKGAVYTSGDAGECWSKIKETIPGVSSLLIVR